MTCSSCAARREAIKQAIKAGDMKKVVSTTVQASAELAENVGRKLVRLGR